MNEDYFPIEEVRCLILLERMNMFQFQSPLRSIYRGFDVQYNLISRTVLYCTVQHCTDFMQILCPIRVILGLSFPVRDQ